LRLTTTTASLRVRRLVECGASGMMNPMAMAQREQTAPMIRNSYRHEASEVADAVAWIRQREYERYIK
jgi:hypothetical protein